MIVVSRRPHAEIGRDDHREGAPHFTKITLIKEEVNATKEENKELKDQNELLKEDAVFFIADDAEEADDVVNALEGEITVFNVVNTHRYFIKIKFRVN